MKHEKYRLNKTTGEMELVNSNFLQLYEDNIDLIIEISNENPTSIKVFLYILKLMDDRNALVMSQSALSEALGLHRNTVGNSISFLKEKKALTVLKSGNTNIYAVNSEIAWKSEAEDKKFAHFTAKVYITASEQEQIKFKTELFGHAVKKTSKNPKNIRISQKESIDNFEKVNSRY